MLYDLRIAPAQLDAAAAWADALGADVELAADDRMLVAEQGDDRAAWDLDGSPGSDDYVAVAPMEPSQRARLTGLAREIRTLAGTPADAESGEHAAAQSALASMGAELAQLVLRGESS